MPVENFNIPGYAGTWYEIARFQRYKTRGALEVSFFFVFLLGMGGGVGFSP